MIKLFIFAILSTGIIFLSWSSMGDKRAHGFYRFFVFEILLALILLNVDHWFKDAFSLLQTISWLLLFTSLLLAIHGFYVLIKAGKSKKGIENTTNLVTTGAYRYIRHPLYSSLLVGTWGVFFKGPSLITGFLSIATTIFIILTARTEEKENIQKFGDEYTGYIKKTKMLIPLIY